MQGYIVSSEMGGEVFPNVGLWYNRLQTMQSIAEIDARITAILHTVPDQPEEQVWTGGNDSCDIPTVMERDTKDDEDVADMVVSVQWLAVEVAPVVQRLINVGVKEEDICRYLGLTKKEEV